MINLEPGEKDNKPIKKNNKPKIKRQQEERLYDFVVEVQCPDCHKYFGIDVNRAEMVKNKDIAEIIKKKIIETSKLITTVSTQAEVLLYSHTFLLTIRCPHCKKLVGLDVSNAKTVTNY